MMKEEGGAEDPSRVRNMKTAWQSFSSCIANIEKWIFFNFNLIIDLRRLSVTFKVANLSKKEEKNVDLDTLYY